MTMGKLLVLLMGLAIVAWAAKTELDGTVGKTSAAHAHTQPREQLDNVRQSARQIEIDAQRRADETVKQADPQ